MTKPFDLSMIRTDKLRHEFITNPENWETFEDESGRFYSFQMLTVPGYGMFVRLNVTRNDVYHLPFEQDGPKTYYGKQMWFISENSIHKYDGNVYDSEEGITSAVKRLKDFWISQQVIE